jgi:hypothetical protein
MADDQKEGGVKIQDFILERELAAVYLLMDHISEFPSKAIPQSINDPVFRTPGDKKGGQ